MSLPRVDALKVPRSASEGVRPLPPANKGRGSIAESVDDLVDGLEYKKRFDIVFQYVRSRSQRRIHTLVKEEKLESKCDWCQMRALKHAAEAM